MKAKGIVGLDCEASAAAGIKLVLHTRMEEMCALRSTALDWSDIEGVHDMRVASRRLRSALRDFRPLMKRRKMRRAGEELKQVADALGFVRDDDVAIAALEKLAAEAPADVVPGIEQFAAERRERREGERASLTEAITEDHLLSLQSDFDQSLADAFKVSRKRKKKDDDDALHLSFRQAGMGIIEARFEELRSLSASLYQPFITRPLHDMRIAAKRLRYAIELFAQCWDENLTPFSKEVGEMQTSLGELHDCDVWLAEFGALLERQDKNDAAGTEIGIDVAAAEKRRAAVWLLRYFVKARTQHYRDALARWHDWETSDFSARLIEQLEVKKPLELSPSLTLSATDAVAADLDAQASGS